VEAVVIARHRSSSSLIITSYSLKAKKLEVNKIYLGLHSGLSVAGKISTTAQALKSRLAAIAATISRNLSHDSQR